MTAPGPPGRQQAVVLRHVDGRPTVVVHELCGADELAVADDSTASAVKLVDRLLRRAVAAEHVTAVDLCPADRDRILAAAQAVTFGDQVVASPTCQGCGERYDLDFSLAALVAGIDAATDEAPVVTDAIPVPGAGTVRLPVGRDELAVSAVDGEQRAGALLERCLSVTADAEEELDADDDLLAEVEAVLTVVAPTVDQVLTAACPGCGRSQDVRFDVQTYLLGMLVAGRDRVLVELHRLASAYGWSAEAILALPRRDRSHLAGLIEANTGGRVVR